MNKIQQHCYTRAKQGLFRKSEGYDTVARSAGLDESFITTRLHPFCYYHPSRIMQAKRVPAEEFPRMLTVVHFPENLLMIGQTVYVEQDFTGQRTTFFTHNFLVPRHNDFCPSLLARIPFLTSTEWDELPELDSLPVLDLNNREKPGPLPFDDARMYQLICALLDAVTGTKKVYVILPGLDWVLPVLMWLFERLPKEAAQTLSFTTYSREPENKKFLHLTFLDRGSILPGDSRVEHDYVFNFDENYFCPVNMPQISEEELREKIGNFSLPSDQVYEEEEEEKALAPKSPQKDKAKSKELKAFVARLLKRK